MKIYISGGIHNQPEGADGHRGSDAFRKVANLVSQLGHIPVVPHDIPPIHRSHGSGNPCPPAYSPSAACYMRGDLVEMLSNCDAILMIGEWQHSVGAQREHSVACWTGMPIFYDARSLPDNRPYDGEPFKSRVENVQAVEAKRVSGSYCPTCGRPPQHEETWCANAFHIQGPPRMKVSKEGLALARRLADRELPDNAEEKVTATELSDEDNELRNFQLSWGHPEATRADMEATYAHYASKKAADFPAAQFSEELRRYGHGIIDQDDEDWTPEEAKKLVDKIAAWVVGERL